MAESAAFSSTQEAPASISTLRMEGTQMAVISHDGMLLRSMPCPVPVRDRHRLRGARRAMTYPPPLAGPITVQRRVSQRGQIMVAT